MARPPLIEERGAQRDGTAQSGRRNPELDAEAALIDERGPEEMIRLARRFAGGLMWYGPDNRPGGWWAPAEGEALPVPGEPPRGGPSFFDGIGPGGLSEAEVAAFAADPAAFADPRYDVLRRPHMALLLAAVRLMRHGRNAVNAFTERHMDYHLRTVLGLSPRPPQPDRAYVLFELAAGVAAAEVPEGLRLLAGRDAERRERLYRLERPMVVNRARVARLATAFVDRETIGIPQARRAITGTPEEQNLFLLAIALGAPQPGDWLPDYRGRPLDAARLAALARLIGFAPTALAMELFELRALIARKARRADEAGDWARINATLEAAGRAKRGDPAWRLQPANPRDFTANLATALQGPPDLGGLTEVATVDDLALHLDREDVRTVIRTRLFLDVDAQFAPMMALKRAISTDWSVINNQLENAGRRKRPDQPGWVLPIADPADFPANLTAAIGPIDFAAAGAEAGGVADLDGYLARCTTAEAYFFLPAEDIARLIAAFSADEATPAGAALWQGAYGLLARAYARKVRAEGASMLRAIRENDGLRAALEAVLGPLPQAPEGWMEALGRYAAPDEVALVRAALAPGGPVPEWGRIDAVLEEARRRRLRLPEPVARKQHWRALFARDEPRGDGALWPGLGGVPDDAGPDRPPAAIGFAIASPALALSAGRRTVTLTLGFHDDGGGALVAPVDDHGDTPHAVPFAVTLSGGKGWITPSSVAFRQVPYAAQPGAAPVDADTPLIALQIALVLDDTAEALATNDAAGAFGATPWPVLRLMLRPVWDPVRRRFDTAYERFRGVRLARVHLAVAAGAPGLWPLKVETEAGVADGKKPFEPFGTTPSRGSELAFSHADLLNKRLTRLGLNLEWLGGPADLAAHYRLYGARDFSAQLSLVDGGVRTSALGPPAPLFGGNDAGAPVRIERATGDAARLDAVVAPLPADVRAWRRFATLRLSGTDFGHHAFAGLALLKSVTLANELRKGTDVVAADYTVNPPYTPKLKRLDLDFAAVHEIDLARYDRSRAVDRLFHVEAFGIVEAGAPGWTLLPEYDCEGALYIGLSGVEAPQSLSLLFAAAPAGGGAGRTGPLAWSYLDSDGWKGFAEPPEDDTDGLTRAGIVRLALPAAEPDARMPGELYWLRAAMAEGAANAAALIDVHAQAGTACAMEAGGTGAPLPAGTVRALADAAPGIARVRQPYASLPGQAAEGSQAFRIRVSERLRHKGRALTLWDYERLVLERFPAVHTAKCLPARLVDGRPGPVQMVVIPDIRAEAHAQARADSFSPRAPARLLDDIAACLSAAAPAAVRIEVRHPVFLPVRVRLGVRFRPGGDEAYDRRRLAERLNRYLAPWAFDEGAQIAIGQRVDATSIVAFVDQLPFVDFVGGCRLFISTDEEQTFHPGLEDGGAVEAPFEDGILAPAARHEIDVIGDEQFRPERFVGVGYMKVELDFVVG
ncbi:MAG TPA: baseplate J/gp47 family protein [Xanthobacteraceae bacterium]|nr:baseplate J/gp47 family protein [Xanthobacteraceae bacterium]